MRATAPARARVVFEGFTGDSLPAPVAAVEAVREGDGGVAHRTRSTCVKRHAVIS